MEIYRVLRQEGIPPRIRHILWDVNGTITQRDIPDQEVMEEMVALAQSGVHHSFITGRDKRWLEKMLISPLLAIPGSKQCVGSFHFYPELGLMRLDPMTGQVEITELLKGHPLASPDVRQTLAGLFHQPAALERYQGLGKEGYFIGVDADGNLFLIPETSAVEFPHFIWSDSKQLMGTAEVLRNPDGSLNQDCAASINDSAEKLEQTFKRLGLNKLIKVSPVSTALNLVPIVGNLVLDKDMTAGIALSSLAGRLGVSIHELCSQTAAIGDGTADLLFTTPVLGLIPMFFVGPKSQLKPTVLQEKQVVLVGEGAIQEGGEVGPKVTREVLKLIKERCQ